MRDCPNLKNQDKGSGKAQESNSNDASRKKHFYDLHSRVSKSPLTMW